MNPGRPLRLRQLLARLFALSGVIVVVAAVAGSLSFVHLLDDRHQLLNRIEPANLLVSQLLSNYLDEETGVRGYALSDQSLFLQPYQAGVAAVATEDHQLTALLPTESKAGVLLGAIHQRANAWSEQFAQPSLAAIAAGNAGFDTTDELNVGKNLFDSLRASISDLQQELAAEQTAAQSRLQTASDQLGTVMIVSLVVILLNGIVIWIALRRLVVHPLADVSADARVVSGGHLDHRVRRTGPTEVADLASDIEMMRNRIFEEVAAAQDVQAQLNTTIAELARSNEDLEQFAYVASHDLQEPLRKVASFCQLLEQRYGDQLDERGTQYIAFAVDGAKRMQALISDLLAFSRIGRTTERFVDVDLEDCFASARSNLASMIEQERGSVEKPGPLPTVQGDRTLLSALLQNLIGNALKFHAEADPVVVVEAKAGDEDQWLFSVTDNGIGIEPRFAERIFVIFQRLHGREAFGGTGIGLALCRKIVEFHGGRIWLDTGYQPGTRFWFTLPQLPRPEPETPQETQENADDIDSVADQPG